MKLTTKELILTGLFTALTAVAAQLSLPLPFSAVPFTLQVFAVLLAGSILGWRLGGLSLLIYLLLGATGVPIFSQMRGGLSMLTGPTGGYLLSYPFAAAFVGRFAKKNKLATTLLANLGGLVIIYLLGVTQLKVVADYNWQAAFVAGALPFIPLDLAKGLLAALVSVRVRKTLGT